MMPKTLAKLRPDIIDVAYRIVQGGVTEGLPQPPGDEEEHPEAARRGRRGWRRHGAVRAPSLSGKAHTLIATKSAKAM